MSDDHKQGYEISSVTETENKMKISTHSWNIRIFVTIHTEIGHLSKSID